MKITFVIPFASLKGGIRVVATYARELVEQGHSVTVISQPYPAPSQIKQTLRKILGRPPHKTKPKTTLFDFLKDAHIVLDRPRPVAASDVPDADAIIATWWETANWVADLPPEKGRKFYLLQDYEMFDYLPQDEVAGTYDLPLQKLAVSSYIRDEIRTQHGNHHDIRLQLNAVDMGQFEAPRRSKTDPLTVGVMYAGAPRKNMDLAIDVLRAAKVHLPDLQAEVFGARAPKEGQHLPDWVRFAENPDQSEIPRIYARCDLWLFTSKNEGFGLPLLEAMACRTPVLATRAGAAADLVTGENGVLLDPISEAFVAQIKRFAEMDSETWQAFSEAAYKTACAHTWAAATRRLLDHLQPDGQAT